MGINPVFLKRKGKEEFTHLTKGSEYVLASGDTFGLIADEFPLTVHIPPTNSNSNTNTDSTNKEQQSVDDRKDKNNQGEKEEQTGWLSKRKGKKQQDETNS